MTTLVDAEASSPAADDGEIGLAPIPWRAVIRWALIGTVVMVLVVFVDFQRHGGSNPVSLVQPGSKGPAAALFHHDYPGLELPAGPGLDGQMYYAVARDPFDLHTAARSLDRPRYRLQHPLLSWLGAAVHPTGGGDGLIWGLFLVTTAGLFLGGLATGVLSTSWRGPPWLAAVFPLLPGAYWSLRVSVSDALGLALALAAIALALRSRTVLAVVAGILAVLAKEPMVLVLVGWAIARRTRRDTLVAAIPAAVAVGWMIVLRLVLPGSESAATGDLALPGVGLVSAATGIWSDGRELVGMACTLAGIGIGVAALWVRRLRHPLSWVVAVQLAYLAVMGKNPLGVNFGATRMVMPIMITSLIVLLTPQAVGATGRAHAAAEPTPAPGRVRETT